MTTILRTTTILMEYHTSKSTGPRNQCHSSSSMLPVASMSIQDGVVLTLTVTQKLLSTLAFMKLAGGHMFQFLTSQVLVSSGILHQSFCFTLSGVHSLQVKAPK